MCSKVPISSEKQLGALHHFFSISGIFMSHQMCNFASGHPRDMVLISNNRFLGMGNHLGPFSEASDQPEGQELGGGAVGGQEVLQEVKF